MTIEELAKYKVPVTGVMASSARIDAIAVLQQAGRIRRQLADLWDNAEVTPAQAAQEVKDYMAALEQMERTNAGRAFTDAQRADVERAAHIAAAIAKVLKQKGLWDNA